MLCDIGKLLNCWMELLFYYYYSHLGIDDSLVMFCRILVLKGEWWNEMKSDWFVWFFVF